jgi:hypothetical protein
MLVLLSHFVCLYLKTAYQIDILKQNCQKGIPHSCKYFVHFIDYNNVNLVLNICVKKHIPLNFNSHVNIVADLILVLVYFTASCHIQLLSINTT